MSGLSKVLLQMKYQQIVPSLHSSNLNPNISFDTTPFEVNQELRSWPRPLVDNQEIPRIAGISSFGAGGSNAHILVREYEAEQLDLLTESRDPAGVMIPLSARTEAQLLTSAKNLKHYLAANKVDLYSVAYTLQTGREPMEERLGFIVTSVQQLEEKLGEFISCEPYIDECFRGQVKPNIETLAVLTSDSEFVQVVTSWISRKKYSKLLELWVKGLQVDWNGVYVDQKPRRISLPNYPFARDRYWASQLIGARDKAGMNSASFKHLHPLLHHNASTFSEQRYSSIFSGKEFFLADHVVGGQCLLPGVVYIEMVRRAVVHALEAKNGIGESPDIQINNVVWLRPAIVESSSLTLHTSLEAQDNDSIYFEIFSQEPETSAKVFCQGSVTFNTISPRIVDIPTTESACSNSLWNADQCYQVFAELGFEYGPSMRGINKLFIGDDQVLAKLKLPASIHDSIEDYQLHPSLLDAALQATIGLFQNTENAHLSKNSKMIPFALESIQVSNGFGNSMWAVARRSNGCTVESPVQKIDIDLCNDQGEVCAQLLGYSSRAVNSEPVSKPALIVQPIWEDLALELKFSENRASQQNVGKEFAEHIVFHLGATASQAGFLQTKLVGCRCIELESSASELDLQYQSYALTILKQIQALPHSKPKEKVLLQILIFHTLDQDEAPRQSLFSGLKGILQTAQLENPKLLSQTIELGSDCSQEVIESTVRDNALLIQDQHIRYLAQSRQVCRWYEKTFETTSSMPWKPQGVYLITGGLGGLGLIFANEIARKTTGATVILTGRSPHNEAQDKQLQSLKMKNINVEYQQLDVSNKQAVVGLVNQLNRAHGQLNGIIHSAGVLRDSYIYNKTEADFVEVLSPKVNGIVALDEASQNQDLDFVLMFSSISGVFGNTGQADYAAANAFMDQYAEYRNHLVASGKRRGLSISVNWPLWQSGGMKLDAAQTKMMLSVTGMVPLGTVNALEALYRAWSSNLSQLMILEGDPQRLSQSFGIRLHRSPEIIEQTAVITESLASPVPESRSNSSQPDVTKDTSEPKSTIEARGIVIELVSELLKVNEDDIDTSDAFSEYGFDSVSLTALTNLINQRLGLELAPTIFFEHTTLHSFSDYLDRLFSTGHAASRLATVSIVENTELNTATSAYDRNSKSKQNQVLSVLQKNLGKNPRRFGEQKLCESPSTVAVVGMSARFPMAAEIADFWQNLLEGRDCISEVPNSRWDWQALYGNPLTEGNKTNIKWGGFIDGLEEFDSLFFGISPNEAIFMDPQQRLLMIHVWKAIEDAGYSSESLAGSQTAIYVGTAQSGYSSLIAQANVAIEGYSSTGSVSSVGPNRVSYLLDIHGPSEPIETACSSSLVAIHRAVNCIESGECEGALVGGINTIVSPEGHISFSKAGMLSEDGRCKTFSSQADGYVRGEGVGILYLKPLEKAEQDGDHIYGVVKGSAENHGGRAASLTAPNPTAQADLLETAYRKAGIDPRTVGYIEAHGTGTELGDPIEINGLKNAFERRYSDSGDSQVLSAHCGLGSVKTNIGHLELAAGVAGVIKVLLQLKHKTLVKSLHCETLNPFIGLEGTPFYTVNENQEWTCLSDDSGKAIPRRAGISSFGFGGVNAHVIIEEYIPLENFVLTNRKPVNTENPVIIILSAKTEQSLNVQAKCLLTEISTPEYSDQDLLDIAYTLQVGRDEMAHRLAFTVDCIDVLKQRLIDFIGGRQEENKLFSGEVQFSSTLSKSTKQPLVDEQAILSCIENRQYEQLVSNWISGQKIDWKRLYSDTKTRRISLPTYAFENDRCWITDFARDTQPTSIAKLHPLVHVNTSDIHGPQFTSMFSGEEFYLRDHQVQDKPVLPGVAYLEMARASWQQIVKNNDCSITISNVGFFNPILLDESPMSAKISLVSQSRDQAEFKIYSEAGQDDSVTTHCSGYINTRVENAPSNIDLEKIRSQCSLYELNASECYNILGGMDLNYGAAHQSIQCLYANNDQVLAKIILPACVSDTKDEFVLHPSIIDGALQACVGLLAADLKDKPEAGKPALPFAVDSLEIFRPANTDLWALIHRSAGCKPGDDIQKCDIQLVNEQGELCIRIEKFSSRILSDISAAEPLELKQPTVNIDPISSQSSVLEDRTTQYLRKLIAIVVGVSSSRLRVDTPLETYGINSIMVMKLSSQLEGAFGSLSKTLFFEYQTVRALSGYFVESHREKLVTLLGQENTRSLSEKGNLGALIANNSKHESKRDEIVVERKNPSDLNINSGYQTNLHSQGSSKRSTVVHNGALDIAIIGLSGRYPQSENIEAFWDNLRAGRDCITEIPAELGLSKVF